MPSPPAVKPAVETVKSAVDAVEAVVEPAVEAADAVEVAAKLWNRAGVR